MYRQVWAAVWCPVQCPHMHLGALQRSNQVFRNTFYVRTTDKGIEITEEIGSGLLHQVVTVWCLVHTRDTREGSEGLLVKPYGLGRSTRSGGAGVLKRKHLMHKIDIDFELTESVQDIETQLHVIESLSHV